MKVLLIVCAMVFAVPVVHALSGNELVDACKATDDGFCVGYILGVKDGFDVPMTLTKHAPLYCVDEQHVINSQLVKVVLKYLNDHPESLQYSASSIILDALSKAFPCPVEPEKPKK